MGIRSDVAVAIKRKTIKKLSATTREFLDAASDERHEAKEGVLWIFKSVKWYVYEAPISGLYEELRASDGGSYLIVTACPEFPDSFEDDAGDWNDNPWNVERVIEVTVAYTVDGRSD